jgi:hypothetical protein
MRFSPNCADDGPNHLISKVFSDFPCQVNYLPALVKTVSLTLEVRRAYLFRQEVPDQTTSEWPLGDPGR